MDPRPNVQISELIPKAHHSTLSETEVLRRRISAHLCSFFSKTEVERKLFKRDGDARRIQQELIENSKASFKAWWMQVQPAE
ncbi:hypothetical protein AOLI_G00290420 [Acnodon oligacanthus]